MPQMTLKGNLDKGKTPLTPSYKDTKRDIRIVSAKAGANNETVNQSFDDNERSEWMNDASSAPHGLHIRSKKKLQ